MVVCVDQKAMLLDTANILSIALSSPPLITSSTILITMSSHSRAFALAIGFPIAAALSSLTSLSRFDASCLAFPPHLAEEEDLVESSLEDSYQDPNKPVRLNYGLGIFMVVIFATSIGAQWLPGWGPEAVAVSTVSVSIVRGRFPSCSQ